MLNPLESFRSPEHNIDKRIEAAKKGIEDAQRDIDTEHIENRIGSGFELKAKQKRNAHQEDLKKAILEKEALGATGTNNVN